MLYDLDKMPWIKSKFNLTHISNQLRNYILVMIGLNFKLTLLIEYLFNRESGSPKKSKNAIKQENSKDKTL